MDKKKLAKIKSRLLKRLKNAGIMTDTQTIEELILVIEELLDEKKES